MMDEDLKDLSPSHSYYSTFGFYITGKAKIASEVTEEILDITKKVIEMMHGFFIPTGIEYRYLTLAHETSQIDIFNTEWSSGPVMSVVIPDNGMSFDRFKLDVDCIVIPKGQIKLVYEIKMYGRTKFVLKGGERYIEGVTWTNVGGKVKFRESAKTKLFWITISFPEYAVNEAAGRDAPAYYFVQFETIVHAYAENTDIGKANRALFRNIIKKFYANFDVYDTMFWSDWSGEEELEYIAFKEEIYPEWKD